VFDDEGVLKPIVVLRMPARVSGQIVKKKEARPKQKHNRP
jgi:hypothetical protein